MPHLLEPVLLDGVTVSQSRPALLDTHEPPLSAPLKLSFDYTRSVGPTLSQFFTALRERRIVGVRGSDGRVHVPPAEYDPVTYEHLTEIVPVASVGTIQHSACLLRLITGTPQARLGLRIVLETSVGTWRSSHAENEPAIGLIMIGDA